MKTIIAFLVGVFVVIVTTTLLADGWNFSVQGYFDVPPVIITAFDNGVYVVDENKNLWRKKDGEEPQKVHQFTTNVCAIACGDDGNTVWVINDPVSDPNTIESPRAQVQKSKDSGATFTICFSIDTHHGRNIITGMVACDDSVYFSSHDEMNGSFIRKLTGTIENDKIIASPQYYQHCPLSLLEMEMRQGALYSPIEENNDNYRNKDCFMSLASDKGYGGLLVYSKEGNLYNMFDLFRGINTGMRIRIDKMKRILIGKNLQSNSVALAVDGDDQYLYYFTDGKILEVHNDNKESLVIESNLGVGELTQPIGCTKDGILYCFTVQNEADGSSSQKYALLKGSRSGY